MPWTRSPRRPRHLACRLAGADAAARHAGPGRAGGGLAGPCLGGCPSPGCCCASRLARILAEHLWHKRMGLIAAGWAALLLLPWALAFGPLAAAGLAWHAVLLEYLPFVTLIFALFTVGGGIVVAGGPWGTPAGNTLLLAVGTGLASVMGTTGAAMVLIHPLLRANAHRSRKVHLVVFFILLVANVGGSLTPLGDPPLFLGFLKGVPFFWPAANLLAPMLVMAGLLLAAFWLLDRRLAAADPPCGERPPLRIKGLPNIGAAGRGGRHHRSRRRGGVAPTSICWASGSRWRGWSAWLAMVAIGLLSLRLTPAGRPGRQPVLLGALRGGGEAVRRHLRLHGPGRGDAAPGGGGALRLADRPGRGAGRQALAGGLFLGDRRAVRLPRQCADLCRVLRTRRRRPEAADRGAGADAAGDLLRRRSSWGR